MSALNQFTIIGVADSDFATLGAGTDNPAQVFSMSVPNGDREPFRFAVWLNPFSKWDEMRSLKGKTIAVTGILRGRFDESHKCVVKLIASDIRVIKSARAMAKGDYV